MSGARTAKTAKRLLTNLLQRLRGEHPGAAGSLEEGLDETLTVMGFNLPEWLERTLSTTNALENLIGSVRNLGHRDDAPFAEPGTDFLGEQRALAGARRDDAV